MLVLHANWSSKALHLWAESLDRFVDRDDAASDESRVLVGDGSDDSGGSATAVASSSRVGHTFCLDSASLRTVLDSLALIDPPEEDDVDEDEDGDASLVSQQLLNKSSNRNPEPKVVGKHNLFGRCMILQRKHDR